VKIAALQRLEAGAGITEVARACEVNPNLLHRWRKEFREGPGHAFPGLGRRRWDVTKIAELERNVGQQALEIDILKGCLQRIEENRILRLWLEGRNLPADPTANRRRGHDDRRADVRARPSQPRRLLSIRSGSRARGRDIELRDAIQRIALEFPYYGRPQIVAELRRRGWIVGHRRVGRILREDNLLCLRKPKFVVATTDSSHRFRVYPNLAHNDSRGH
jgi:transposase-like protein